jgi:hypothetical protein
MTPDDDTNITIPLSEFSRLMAENRTLFEAVERANASCAALLGYVAEPPEPEARFEFNPGDVFRLAGLGVRWA